MADFLSEKRDEITTRLQELKPQVDEYHRLEAAAEALAGIPGALTTTAPANGRRRPGRPRGSKAAASPNGVVTPQGASVASTPALAKRARLGAAKRARQGRPKGSGSRATQAHSHVIEQPGITITELAAKMGTTQAYLYRVLPGLEQERKVEKKGRGWYPGAATA